MTDKPTTFYKYRAFGTSTLDSLCHDELYFAHPGTFNDPLDCNPTIECDSDLEQLRFLLSILVQQRITAEVLASLKAARLRGARAKEHALKRARTEAAKELENIAYHATNPDYSLSTKEAEVWLLTQEIEQELRRYYERGVCCFSTTYSSPLLWSHYGDQHRGLCMGYTTNRVPEPVFHKVIYGGSRSIKTSVLVQAFSKGEQAAKAELDRDVLLRKARGWGYEREWRLIGEQGLQDSPLLLQEVTFGLRCPASVMHSVVQALAGREKAVNFYEMYEVRNKFVLRRRKLDIYELSAQLPRTAESGLEIFGDDIEMDAVQAASHEASAAVS